MSNPVRDVGDSGRIPAPPWFLRELLIKAAELLDEATPIICEDPQAMAGTARPLAGDLGGGAGQWLNTHCRPSRICSSRSRPQLPVGDPGARRHHRSETRLPQRTGTTAAGTRSVAAFSRCSTAQRTPAGTARPHADWTSRTATPPITTSSRSGSSTSPRPATPAWTRCCREFSRQRQRVGCRRLRLHRGPPGQLGSKPLLARSLVI